MKYYAFILFLCCCGYAVSATLTVDNRYPSIAHHTSIQAAHDAAAIGDTIYIYPSTTSYGDLSVSKTIALFGGGWGYNNYEAGVFQTQVGNVMFGIGSVGSKIIGFQASGLIIQANGLSVRNCDCSIISINANNISISSNSIGYIIIEPNCSGVLIEKSRIYSVVNPYYDVYSVFIKSGCDVIIKNNLFVYGGWYAIRVLSNSQLDLRNNVVINPYGVLADIPSLVTSVNNIFNGYSPSDVSYYSYNVFSGTAQGNNGIGNIPLSNLFVDVVNGDYHLAPGSPAIGAGEGGVDCGAYGGIAPFDDTYNTPPLPTIIELTTPTMIVPANEPMPVHIRATTSGN